MTNLDRLPSALILSSLTTLLVACGGKEEVVQAPPPKPRPVVTQPEPVVVEVKAGKEPNRRGVPVKGVRGRADDVGSVVV